MATMIEVKDEYGHLMGRCDARCYNAKGSICQCVCLGLNHGEGLQYAKQQTDSHGPWLKKQWEDHGTLNAHLNPKTKKGDQP